MKLVTPIPVPIIQNEKDAVLETSDCTPSIPVSESQDPGSYPEPISAPRLVCVPVYQYQ